MKNGAELLDRLNIHSLGDAAGAAIAAIKINSISMEWRNGRPMVVKRRRPVAKPVAAVANWFFQFVGDPIAVFGDMAEWQHWETKSFRLLNGGRFTVFADGEDVVCEDKLPGENLREILARGALTEHILEVSARELRRAHDLYSSELGGEWSHGDTQMSNVIYDSATDTARLIDFEVIHDRTLPAVLRHADDLLVFLQDMMWRVSEEQWVPFAMAFVNAYDRPEVATELVKQMVLPRGVAGLWWKVRTNHFHRATLARRVEALRMALIDGCSCETRETVFTEDFEVSVSTPGLESPAIPPL